MDESLAQSGILVVAIDLTRAPEARHQRTGWNLKDLCRFGVARALEHDAINPPDIQKNTDFLERAFRSRGFTTRQLPNDTVAPRPNEGRR